MTYKIHYQGRNYEVRYYKEILTDGETFIINHVIQHGRTQIVGKSLEEVVRRFCEKIEDEKRR